MTHLKRPWCWERLKVGGEGDDRGWEGWMASPTEWTWLWINFGSWWWTGKPGMLQFMGLQSRTWLSDWTELNWSTYYMSITEVSISIYYFIYDMLRTILGSPGGASVKEPTCQWRRHKKCGFRKIPWRKAWQPTLVFLTGGSHRGGAWWATVHRISKVRYDWSDLAPTHAEQSYIIGFITHILWIERVNKVDILIKLKIELKADWQ